MGYRKIIIYTIDSRIKVHQGTTLNQITGNLNYKVFGNGKLVRIYNTTTSDVFHEYEIYASEGISTALDSGATQISPGIQARNIQASMLKQLSVTKTSLTITQIPPLSDAITVIYAKRSTK